MLGMQLRTDNNVMAKSDPRRHSLSRYACRRLRGDTGAALALRLLQYCVNRRVENLELAKSRNHVHQRWLARFHHLQSASNRRADSVRLVNRPLGPDPPCPAQ